MFELFWHGLQQCLSVSNDNIAGSLVNVFFVFLLLEVYGVLLYRHLSIVLLDLLSILYFLIMTADLIQMSIIF